MNRARALVFATLAAPALLFLACDDDDTSATNQRDPSADGARPDSSSPDASPDADVSIESELANDLLPIDELQRKLADGARAIERDEELPTRTLRRRRAVQRT